MSLCLTDGKALIFGEFYGIFTTFFQKKSGKRSLSFILHELFTSRIVSIEREGWSNFPLYLKP